MKIEDYGIYTEELSALLDAAGECFGGGAETHLANLLYRLTDADDGGYVVQVASTGIVRERPLSESRLGSWLTRSYGPIRTSDHPNVANFNYEKRVRLDELTLNELQILLDAHKEIANDHKTPSDQLAHYKHALETAGNFTSRMRLAAGSAAVLSGLGSAMYPESCLPYFGWAFAAAVGSWCTPVKNAIKGAIAGRAKRAFEQAVQNYVVATAVVKVCQTRLAGAVAPS